MELRQLSHFLATVREGSINRAAASLRMTQPALSQSIRALERSLGAELLIRTGGGIRPTRIGEEFARYAQTITREADKATQQVASMRGAGGGHLAIGVMSLFTAYAGPLVINEFLIKNPEVRLEVSVMTASYADITKKLQNAEWDLALTLASVGHELGDNMVVRSLKGMQSSVYCNASHPLAGKAAVQLEDMRAFDWVLTMRGKGELLLGDAYKHERPNIRLRTDSMQLILSLVRDHPFLCMMPDDAVADDVREGRLVRVDQNELGATSDIAVVYSSLVQRSPAMRSFMAIVAQYLDAEAEPL